METKKQKKITLATIKSFVRKNRGRLFIDKQCVFDGNIDGIRNCEGGFKPVRETHRHLDATLGIEDAWFVGQSRDYFSLYTENGFNGFEINNSCGCFRLAIKQDLTRNNNR